MAVSLELTSTCCIWVLFSIFIFVFFFLTPCIVVAIQSFMECIPIKKIWVSSTNVSCGKVPIIIRIKVEKIFEKCITQNHCNRVCLRNKSNINCGKVTICKVFLWVLSSLDLSLIFGILEEHCFSYLFFIVLTVDIPLFLALFCCVVLSYIIMALAGMRYNKYIKAYSQAQLEMCNKV